MIYIDSLITRKVKIPMSECGKNISDILNHYLQPLEGKCIAEGYLKKNTIKIINYDSGKLYHHYIQFEVVFECKLALPTVNQQLVCEVESNTIAGLQCKLHMEDESPFVVFLAKDHHMDNPEFFSCDVGSIIHVSVIGQRYSVNDSNISVIAKLLYKQ
jgi:DNA-directed RNA polymerase subunit E'/Rpb7